MIVASTIPKSQHGKPGNGKVDDWPYPAEAERLLPAELILEPAEIPEVAEIISAADVYQPQEQLLLTAIFAVHKRGLPVDAATVSDELQQANKLDEAGGPDGIIDRMASVPHGAHAVAHAKLIRQYSLRRKFKIRCITLGEMIRNPASTLEDIRDFADGLSAHLVTDDEVLLGPAVPNGEMIRNAKPPDFLVRNFITRGTVTVWSAPEKAWKTTLAHHLALVATGHGKFLGIYDGLVTTPVVFFSGESGAWPLRSMQQRILEWTYPALADFDGEKVSTAPDPNKIPMTWLGDPPDLGDARSIAAIERLITKTGAGLLILDPSQAMFGSIAEDVKNDAAMRQYIKKLQLLARKLGVAIVVLHHFRQHVAPGFPKRSDSSFGGFMKFCDTWVLVNSREAQTGDEPPGSGKLWITWGSRDGFGATHAIDIDEGTHETGRYFNLEVVEVESALNQVAERAAQRKGSERRAVRKASGDKRRAEIKAKLIGLSTGVTVATVAGMMNIGRTTIAPTINAMVSEGELVNVPAEYLNHGKVCWNAGVALPETAAAIKELATKRGWRDSESSTGVTGVTGVGDTRPSPVGTEGEPPVCQRPYTGDADTRGVGTPPGVVEIEEETDTRWSYPSPASISRGPRLTVSKAE